MKACIYPNCGKAPQLPAFDRSLTFAGVQWNQFAGERGGYVARSICGLYEAVAERLANGWQFWLVRVSDGATIAEVICAS